MTKVMIDPGVCGLVTSVEAQADEEMEEVKVNEDGKIKAEGKEVTLYHSKESGSPLIILNNSGPVFALQSTY